MTNGYGVSKCTAGLVLSIVMTIVFLVAPVMGQSQKPIAVSESPSGMVCMTKMRDAYEPGTSSVRRVTITTTNNKGEKGQYVAGQAYKTFPDGKRMVLTMLEPQAVKGITYLYRAKGDGVEVFEYLPAIRRVRQITGVQAYDALLGTDFTVGDLGLIAVPKTCELVEVAQRAGAKAYKVEEKMPGSVFYSRTVTWIGADTFLPQQRDFYDPPGKLWKTELFKDVATIDKIPTIQLVEMKDMHSGYSTAVKFSSVTYGAKVPDELFDSAQLSKVADSGLWK